jgi:hypothetical protein
LPVPKGDPLLIISIFSPHYQPLAAAAEQKRERTPLLKAPTTSRC